MDTAREIVDDPEKRRDVFGTLGGGRTLKAAGAFAALAMAGIERSGEPLDGQLDRARPSKDPIARLPDDGPVAEAWNLQANLRAEGVKADEEAFGAVDFGEARRIAERQLESDVRERFAWLVARRAEKALEAEPEADPRAPRGVEAFAALTDAIREARDYALSGDTRERIDEIRERALAEARPPTVGEAPTGGDEALGWDESSVLALDELGERHVVHGREAWEARFAADPETPGGSA